MERPAILYDQKNSKLLNYISKLDEISNKNVTDFAIHTPINSIQRFLVRYELMKLIKDIPGAVIEMGVCSGNGLFSLIHCHNVLEPTYQYREFFGFDTFEGFPSVHEKDMNNNDVYDQNKVGDFANNSYDKILNTLEIHNNYYYVPTSLKLVKGDVCKSVPEFLADNSNKHILISLLYLDMDLYEPTKVALQNFLPRMAKGSIIAFDELNHKKFPGETLAMLEELGTKYKVKQLLNSHINYCVIE
jgi:hypothetical protein